MALYSWPSNAKLAAYGSDAERVVDPEVSLLSGYLKQLAAMLRSTNREGAKVQHDASVGALLFSLER